MNEHRDATASCQITRIVSGGQTGVDRGALDAALVLGFACGEWCPARATMQSTPLRC